MDVGSIEELKEKAAQGGMFMPDMESTEELIAEYEKSIKEADALLEIVDPESKPFESKYAARKLLDAMVNKLDATRTIGMLEKKTGVTQAMDFRLAALRVKLGVISWECEEPHNAQTDLDMACEFYFPELVGEINIIVGDGNPEDYVYDGNNNVTPPALPAMKSTYICDGMKCLNILGILWSGRGQLHKAFLYLLSASALYKQHLIAKQSWSFSKQLLADTENTFTHTLFYLAQAYGHVGDSKRSSAYCHQTLQRQLADGLNAPATALDWVKNCAGIADFYLAMRQYNNCALALASAERIIKEKVIVPLNNAVESTKADSDIDTTSETKSRQRDLEKAAELEVNLQRRWITLDVSVLRRAFEYHKMMRETLLLGEDPSALPLDENAEDDFQHPAPPPSFSSSSTASAAAASSTTIMPPSPPTAAQEETTTGSALAAAPPIVTTEFFEGLEVPATTLLGASDIIDFDTARKVFLRAAARLESAKKYFVLDGFVTDHTTLLQEHSKLYHYLSEFEADTKRKLAMQSRRFDLLNPLLSALNRSSYEVLHKQVSYELGEASLAMLDLKLDKIRTKGEIDERMLKKAEVNKLNEFCKNAIAMFAHFTWMYAPASAGGSASSAAATANRGAPYMQTLALHELVDAACSKPDEASITTEELRPFLNAHFLMCRALQKVTHAASFAPANMPSNQGHVYFIAASLRKYEWLRKFTKELLEKRSISIEDLPFIDEYRICNEMVELLPQKIDRMCFTGESGLSL